MLLSENWKIESDELNITLYERFINKSGKEYWRPHSYYSSIGDALKGLVNIEVNRTGLKNVEIVVAKIRELHQLIEYGLSSLSLTRSATSPKEAPKTSSKEKNIHRQKEMVKTP